MLYRLLPLVFAIGCASTPVPLDGFERVDPTWTHCDLLPHPSCDRNNECRLHDITVGTLTGKACRPIGWRP